MVKVCGLKRKAWLAIFFCLHLCCVGFLVGSISSSNWFSQNLVIDTDTGQLIMKYKGALLHLKGNSTSYKDLYDDCMSLEDPYPGIKMNSAFCDQFNTFYNAGVAFISFDIIATILVLVITTTIIFEYLHIRLITKFLSLWLSSILLPFATFFHFLAFVVWAGVVKLKYSDCDFYYNTDTSDKNVCGEKGSSLALGGFFYMLFYSVFYYFVVRKIYKGEKVYYSEPLN
jgi:hypothetical protein